MTLQECDGLVRAAESGQDLVDKKIFEFIEGFFKDFASKTDEDKAQMKAIICGLLVPRFYPQGYDFVIERRQEILTAFQDERLSGIVGRADGAYDFSKDSYERAPVTKELLMAIRSVDSGFLSQAEYRLAEQPIETPAPNPATSGIDGLTRLGRIFMCEQVRAPGAS